MVARRLVPQRSMTIRVRDIKVPVDYSLEKMGITQSLLSNWGCRQKFLFKLNRWTPDQPNKNVEFGNLFHHILDLVYSAKRMPSVKAIDKWVDAYLAEWETRNVGRALEDMERHGAVTVMLMGEYLKLYAPDFSEKKFTGVEKVFRVAWNGFLLLGKKDGRYLTKAFKKWIMEHKTRSEMDEETISDLLAFDLQNLFYIIAEEAEDQSAPVHGVLYNVIRNPAHRLKAEESLKQYAERIREDASKRPEHYFLRFEAAYSVADKTEFRRQLLAKLEEIRAFLKGDLPLYRNEAMCKVGHVKCEFLKACASGCMAGYKQKPRLFEELHEL